MLSVIGRCGACEFLMAERLRSSASPAVNLPKAGRSRVLVVDDSASSRDYVAGVVGGLQGVEVTTASSGSAALQTLKAHTFSLVLCDYEMPELSGLHVLQFIRSAYSAIELPVLMLTGRDDENVKLRALRAGANDYILKHAGSEELLARVGTQLELVRTHRTLVATQLRAAEGQKFEAVGHLAEAFAHELNTPAQYIGDNLGFLSESFESINTMMQRLREPRVAPLSTDELARTLDDLDYDYLSAQIPACLSQAQQGIEHVASVVAVMREFTRRDGHARSAQDLNELVRGALAVTHAQWHEVAELELNLIDTLPSVWCVAPAIKQVVLYAIMNAVRAMTSASGQRRARGQLSLSTYETGTHCAVEVADTGRPLPQGLLDGSLDDALAAAPEDEVTRMFVLTRAVVVAEHHGEFSIERRQPTGTRLIIRLPQGTRASKVTEQ